jgi:cytochrome c5
MRTAAVSVTDLLDTADRLLAGDLHGATAAGRHRGAALALRTALEISVDRVLDTAVPGLSRTTGRAKLLCLRCYTAAETARRAKSVWSHLCLGCHYHQYEIGPTHDQVSAWRVEVGELIRELTP